MDETISRDISDLTKDPDPIAQHNTHCDCLMCTKQQEIIQLQKQKMRMQMQTIYQEDFAKNNKKSRLKSKSIPFKPTDQSKDFLLLATTYGKQFISKRADITKHKPIDQIKTNPHGYSSFTTYMKSYHLTLTPKPENPFKISQSISKIHDTPFNSQSIYQQCYNKQQHSLKPTLPIIQLDGIKRPQSIGVFQSTQKKSYDTVNPQSRQIQAKLSLKQQGNLMNLPSFSHNYDTTYRNFYVGKQKNSYSKHNVDEIGNIYKRTTQRNHRSFLF